MTVTDMLVSKYRIDMEMRIPVNTRTLKKGVAVRVRMPKFIGLRFRVASVLIFLLAKALSADSVTIAPND